MTEEWRVPRKHHRDGAGIPRVLAIPVALTVAIALAVGGNSLGAAADEAAPVEASAETAPATTSAVGDALDDAIDRVRESEKLRDLAKAAVPAAAEALAGPTEPGAQAGPTDPANEPTDPPVEATDPPTDPTDPPVEATDPPTDPPVEATDPPTDPPVEATDPPTNPTDPPVEATDPPTNPTGPTDPPVETTDPPTDPTDPPVDTANPQAVPPVTTPPTPTPTVEPNPNPIPVRPRPQVTPRPVRDGEAEAARAARAAAAERAREIALAQQTLTTARLAYDDARRAFASATAEHDAAERRAAEIHDMATDAATRAERSERLLGALVRSLAQQASGSAAAGILLDNRGGNNILYQLGTLDQLSQLTSNVEQVRNRAEADQQRATALAAQEAAAQDLLLSIPVESAKADLDAAKAEFEGATTAFAALETSAPVGLIGLTPLPELVAADTGQLSERGWAKPAVGRISDGFGPRPDRPLPNVGPFHNGTDIGASCKAGVYAATSGVVEAVGSLGTYGNWILINHGNGIETGYAHLASGEILVSVGEPVIAGQVIAAVGSTGASTGCHLHFEVRIDGDPVDAQFFMSTRGVTLGEE